MRTPLPGRPGLLLRALLVALVLALGSAGPVRAEEPIGGPRLQGLEVIADRTALPVPPTSAASFLVADVDTGQVLAARDPHGQFAPASTLKMLTALTLLPRLDPARQVAPAREDVDVDGTKVGLVTQLSYSVQDLLTAMLVTSANDAAGALATAVGGQQAATTLMNAEAARLQARDTRAVNTSGLDAEGQVSSAYDLALIARAGLALPQFRALVATRRAFIPAPDGATIEIATHDKLLTTYEGAIGVKNGYTTAARASFVGAATRNGRTLLVTVMGGEPAVWKDAAALLDWGFAATAAGTPAVGRLVAPEQPPVLAAPTPDAAAARPAPSVAVRTAVDGGLPLVRMLIVVLVGLVLVLALLRRRAVVRARVRRRRAASAAVIDLRDRPAHPARRGAPAPQR